MATSHLQPLLVLLLVCLFFLPTLRGSNVIPYETNIASRPLRVNVTSGEIIPEIETRKGSYRRYGPAKKIIPFIVVRGVIPTFTGGGQQYYITGFQMYIDTSNAQGLADAGLEVYVNLYHNTDHVLSYFNYLCDVSPCHATPGFNTFNFRDIIRWPMQDNLNARIRIEDPWNDRETTVTVVLSEGFSSLTSVDENSQSIL